MARKTVIGKGKERSLMILRRSCVMLPEYLLLSDLLVGDHTPPNIYRVYSAEKVGRHYILTSYTDDVDNPHRNSFMVEHFYRRRVKILGIRHTPQNADSKLVKLAREEFHYLLKQARDYRNNPTPGDIAFQKKYGKPRGKDIFIDETIA